MISWYLHQIGAFIGMCVNRTSASNSICYSDRIFLFEQSLHVAKARPLSPKTPNLQIKVCWKTSNACWPRLHFDVQLSTHCMVHYRARTDLNLRILRLTDEYNSRYLKIHSFCRLELLDVISYNRNTGLINLHLTGAHSSFPCLKQLNISCQAYRLDIGESQSALHNHSRSLALITMQLNGPSSWPSVIWESINHIHCPPELTCIHWWTHMPALFSQLMCNHWTHWLCIVVTAWQNPSQLLSTDGLQFTTRTAL